MSKVLELNNITKKYPGVLALDTVSISFEAGEIHALMGENGAGKSTLIKSVAGAIDIDSGKIIIGDKEYEHITPSDSLRNGVAVIYQEFNLIPSMSVAENIFMGEKIGGKFVADFNKMHKRAAEIFAQFDVDIDTHAMVESLSTAQMQIVEIAKALSKNVKILFMDEPSATLSMTEVQYMFEIIRRLKAKGVAVIYVSHRIDEVFEVCDRVSVMRDGRYIATKEVAKTTRKELVSLMVGRELIESYPARNPPRDEVVLEVRGLTGNGVRDINFQLKKGEILGLGGLVGCGRTELAKLIYGAAELGSGQIIVDGTPVQIKSPHAAIKLGIGLIPEDRKHEGVFVDYPLDWNVVIMCLRRIAKHGVVNQREVNATSDKYINELQIATPSVKQIVKNLSGGNQQKVVLARVLAAQTKIIIFDEPTRGIDVGAKQEIYRLMNALTDEDISIIMISSEMEELLGMSDRIIVLHEGTQAGELIKQDFSQIAVLELASAAK